MECIRNRLLVKFWRVTTRLGPKPRVNVVVGPGAWDVSVADNLMHLYLGLTQMADFLRHEFSICHIENEAVLAMRCYT